MVLPHRQEDGIGGCDQRKRYLVERPKRGNGFLGRRAEHAGIRKRQDHDAHAEPYRAHHQIARHMLDVHADTANGKIHAGNHAKRPPRQRRKLRAGSILGRRPLARLRHSCNRDFTTGRHLAPLVRKRGIDTRHSQARTTSGCPARATTAPRYPVGRDEQRRDHRQQACQNHDRHARRERRKPR